MGPGEGTWDKQRKQETEREKIRTNGMGEGR